MGSNNLHLKHFISEPISVEFAVPPTYQKTPSCPSSFTWKAVTFRVTACLAEWKDFSRHGRMAQNMQPQHLEEASKQGSWGVGKFFFDVETKGGRLFRIYYDRTPKDALDRKGEWILLAELDDK